jgi:hypothetical protein
MRENLVSIVKSVVTLLETRSAPRVLEQEPGFVVAGWVGFGGELILELIPCQRPESADGFQMW